VAFEKLSTLGLPVRKVPRLMGEKFGRDAVEQVVQSLEQGKVGP
jgi:hypothetical protein